MNDTIRYEGLAADATARADTKVPVLFLTHYDRIGAPSRYRYYQFFPRFRDAGIEPTVDYIQSNEMCSRKQRGEWMVLFTLQVFFAYLRRMALLVFKGRRFPVWVIEKELFPYLPFWLEELFLSPRAKVIVDYDDAVFLKYDGAKGVRYLDGKIAKLMQRADVVFSGNAYISEYARKAGARDIRWIPTVVDETRYRVRGGSARQPPVIGWMGAYRNSRHIVSVAAALRSLAETDDFVLRIVGGGRIPPPDGVRVEYRDWSEQDEIRELQEFTVGIMPLVDGDWEKGKCGLKLIQYLAAGVPVVASPIGINCEIVKPGVNGYLASTQEEWTAALRRLLSDRARGQFGAEQCAATVESTFTLAALSPTVISTIKTLGGRECPS